MNVNAPRVGIERMVRLADVTILTGALRVA